MSWLREYADPKATNEEIAERLSISTCEVERIIRRGPADTSGFVVGKVLSAEKHPNADRLQLTVVDVGGKQQQIVCGAWNFGAGATVAVALPGVTLPNGLTLERRELRGKMSEGMILAEDEVDLGTDHDGIMLLPDEVEAGTPLVDVLPLVEDVLEVEITGNRPDLLSVYGLAREVAALYDVPLAPWPGVDPARAADEEIVVDVEDADGCPRYIARRFRDVAIGPSPVWLKARILAAGMRPISNVVDVTNYVMVALGSPLHAFDDDSLTVERDQGARQRPTQARVDLTHCVIQRFQLGEFDRPLIAGMGNGAAEKPQCYLGRQACEPRRLERNRTACPPRPRCKRIACGLDGEFDCRIRAAHPRRQSSETASV